MQKEKLDQAEKVFHRVFKCCAEIDDDCIEHVAKIAQYAPCSVYGMIGSRPCSNVHKTLFDFQQELYQFHKGPLGGYRKYWLCICFSWVQQSFVLNFRDRV